MTQQLIRKNILATSAAIVFIGLTGLMSYKNPKFFLAGCAVGVTGAIFASKKFCLQLKEELERDITVKVKKSLIKDINPEVKHELKEFIDHSQEELEQKLLKIDLELKSILEEFKPDTASTQDLLDNLENQFKSLENILQYLEQDLTTKVKQEIQEIQAFVETSRRQNQSAHDQIKNIKQELKAIKSRLPESGNLQQLITPKTSTKNTLGKELPRGDQVVKWLNNKDIKVEKYRSKASSISEQTFDKLAIYLGKNHAILDEFHGKLRSSVQDGSRFNFSLRNRTQNDIRINTQFGSMLRQAGCLSNYHYDKKTKVMNVAVHRRNDLESFLYGDHFERFIFHEITEFFRSRALNYDCLVNAEVIFPNTDRYELDLIFLVKEHLFWVECKAGSNFNNIDRYLPQYSENHQNFLQLPKTNALVVCRHFDENQAAIRTNLWQNVTVTNPELILTLIKSTLDGTVNQETTESNKCLV